MNDYRLCSSIFLVDVFWKIEQILVITINCCNLKKTSSENYLRRISVVFETPRADRFCNFYLKSARKVFGRTLMSAKA